MDAEFSVESTPDLLLEARRELRAHFAKWGEYGQSLRITDPELHVRNPYGESRLPWDKFERPGRFERLWLLYIDEGTFYILPAGARPGEVGEFLVRKVQEMGGKVK
jgi:hypothetical protein